MIEKSHNLGITYIFINIYYYYIYFNTIFSKIVIYNKINILFIKIYI